MTKVTISNNPFDGQKRLIIDIERTFDFNNEQSAIVEAVKMGIKKLAEKWLEENADKIYDRMNVDAISNMIMIEVAKDLKNDILNKDKK